jgi:hypothetical protein
MTYTGTARGNRIDLDQALPLADGTRVRISVAPEGRPQKGSPQAILELAGTLQPEEAEAILKTAGECRTIDASLWDRQ